MPRRTSCTKVRQTISTLCALRETEAETLRCARRAVRTLGASTALQQRDAGKKKCDVLLRRLHALERPPSSVRRRRDVERAFGAGALAVPGEEETDGVAVLGPGWCTAASRITDLETARRVIGYLERHRSWQRQQLKAWPQPAVPRFISTHHPSISTLQNLPAWQSARIALLACLAAQHQSRRRGVTPVQLQRWMRVMNVHDVYMPALRALVCAPSKAYVAVGA